MPLTRRTLLTSLAATALTSAIAEPKSTLTPTARKAATDKLIAYFTSTAPQLLRPAEGLLQHPSIAPSLPGKEYSASLWDWDTLWTSTALYSFARIHKDPQFHAKLNDHVQGSLLNFLDHQGPDGRLTIMMSGKNVDVFKCLAPRPPPQPPQPGQTRLRTARPPRRQRKRRRLLARRGLRQAPPLLRQLDDQQPNPHRPLRLGRRRSHRRRQRPHHLRPP